MDKLINAGLALLIILSLCSCDIGSAPLTATMELPQRNNTSSQSKLESGLRTNRTADDSAGLGIEDKMRGQISGTEQVSTNAQDGIDVQSNTEEALNDTSKIISKMKEAINNGNYTDEEKEILINELEEMINE